MLPIAAALALATAGADIPSQSAETLRYFVGTWRVVSADPAGGEDLHACYTIQPFVGDMWISGVATSKAAGFGSKDVWGVDRASGEIFRTIFDVSGAYAVVRAPSWKGDTLVLDGNVKSGGGTLRVRETVRRLSEHEFKATWEALRGGKWSAYAVETATRVPDGTCNVS